MASRLEITECDEAGNVTATFVESSSSSKKLIRDAGQGGSRVDVILPKETRSPLQKLLDVFLPSGYPHSVTEDYLEYQVYDSLQAFSSSIAGLLSSRAVLSSVGVGDASASATAALLLSILQESAGRVATILFAHRFGTSLEPECKMYRLLADVFNDIAFVLDCLSPAFPKPIRVVVLSFSSVLRALCGVAAGSAKASLSAHFARWGNLGELNAKDSSQETVISLLGMLAGSLVVSWVTTPAATWTTLILLLGIHLETNRRAVRAVSMRTLNRQRATLVFWALEKGYVPTPVEVSAQERIFERDGVLRDDRNQAIGFCSMGTSMWNFLAGIAPANSKTLSTATSVLSLSEITNIYRDRDYIMWPDMTTRSMTLQVNVVFKKGATTQDQLSAWWQSLALAKAASTTETYNDFRIDVAKVHGMVSSTLNAGSDRLQKYRKQLQEAGWDLDTAALETKGSSRVDISLQS